MAKAPTLGASNSVLVDIASGRASVLEVGYSESSPKRADVSHRLNCNLPGGPGPFLATDSLTFKGSSVWVDVGLNRTIGDVLVHLDLRKPGDKPGENLIDGRSGGGGAWQASFGGTQSIGKIIHYNQSAGNSARNWGYEAGLTKSANQGFVQDEWTPLYSNDVRPADAPPSAALTTSPCYGGSDLLGDGQFSLVPVARTASNSGAVVSLGFRYAIRHQQSTAWSRWQFDFGMYFNPDMRDLRIYYPDPKRTCRTDLSLSSVDRRTEEQGSQCLLHYRRLPTRYAANSLYRTDLDDRRFRGRGCDPSRGAKT